MFYLTYRSFIVSLGVSNSLRAYKIAKKDDSSLQIVPAAIEEFAKVLVD